jgi:hypothetical protein
VAADGKIIFSNHGPADAKKLEEFYKRLDEHLVRNDSNKPPAVTQVPAER